MFPRSQMLQGLMRRKTWRWALTTNLFVPATNHFRIGVHLIRRDLPLTLPKTWRLLIR
jgi:hypothetical protein